MGRDRARGEETRKKGREEERDRRDERDEVGE